MRVKFEFHYNIISYDAKSTSDNIIDPKIHYTVIGNVEEANELLDKLEKEMPNRKLFVDIVSINVSSIAQEALRDDIDNTIQEMINKFQDIYEVDRTGWSISLITQIREEVERILNLPARY